MEELLGAKLCMTSMKPQGGLRGCGLVDDAIKPHKLQVNHIYWRFKWPGGEKEC